MGPEYLIMRSDREVEIIQKAYLYACSKDVEVIKPGNVNIDYPHDDTSAHDFLRSAHDSTKFLFDKYLSLGERLYMSVKASRENISSNTNLGILILVCPIIQSLLVSNKKYLPDALQDVIDNSSKADTKLLCEAINIANPGGLGTSPKLDTKLLPSVSINEIMQESSSYDRLSFQYCTKYGDILDFVVPKIREYRKNIENTDYLLSIVFLEIMANIPDTHIRRKFGEKIAKKTSNQASDLIKIINKERSHAKTLSMICELDYEYKNKGINPGTTADLLLTGIMIERLLRLP